VSKEELPNKIVELDQLRINRNIERVCSCDRRSFMIDTTNRRIICHECGAIVDPYEAMLEMATKGNRLKEQVEVLLEQRKQILDYKPYLLVIRELERSYRGKKTLPNCPRCDHPFYLEELVSWTGREFADARIEAWEKEKQNRNKNKDG